MKTRDRRSEGQQLAPVMWRRLLAGPNTLLVNCNIKRSRRQKRKPKSYHSMRENDERQ